MRYAGAPRLETIDERLPVCRMHQRAPESDVGDDRRGRIDELRIDHDPGPRQNLGSAGRPLLLKKKDLFDREATAKGEIHSSSQNIRDQRVQVRDELHFDLVDLWSTQHIPIIGLHDKVITFHELSHEVGAGPHEFHVPIGQREESSLILSIRSLEQVARDR
ncbi:MAG: hypothetical protein HW416_2707 [Chloroflexi bacterium]|nr:hypothetical protein [Chloroflexota bacterium]